MTVAELIAKLQKMPQDVTVFSSANCVDVTDVGVTEFASETVVELS